MLVICEDCAKKYNIDESRIRARRARFTCNECGHIIIVDKADLSRPLISKKDPGFPPASPVDLLREMEGGAAADANGADRPEAESAGPFSGRQQVRRRNRGVPLFVYFIVALLFALICVSLVTGYLYSDYLYSELLARTLNQTNEFRQSLMIRSTMIFGAAWFVILIFFTLLARSIHQKFSVLVKNANQLGAGEYDIAIVKNGPREVRDLAFALERIRSRLQSMHE